MIQFNLQVCGDRCAHRFDMGPFWRLGDDGVIDVADLPTLGVDQTDHMAQQHTAVRALEGGISVRKVLADIAQCRRAEQGIAQGVQDHVAVGMSQQPMVVCNAHAAQGDEIAFSETVHIVAVANTHKKRPDLIQGVILPTFASD